MRLLGNKTKILPNIERLLAARGQRPGTLIDLFAGSSSVGRRFKAKGWRVFSNDHLPAAHVMAIATVECDGPPALQRLLAARSMRPVAAQVRRRVDDVGDPDAAPLACVLEWLADSAPDEPGLVTRQYSPEGRAGRRYFRPEHARRIDAALAAIRRFRAEGRLDRREHAVLVASVIDAADRVANIAGTYGAYLKHWHGNTDAAWQLRPPAFTAPGADARSAAARRRASGSRAFRRDANRLARRLRGEVLYLDPPYNHRQYAANYHVPSVLAETSELLDPERLAAYEARLYGKTGLRPYDGERSAYCAARGGKWKSRCYDAFADLLEGARGRVGAVVVSYNEEGILGRDELAHLLARFARDGGEFDADRDFTEVGYRRFRSDADHAGRRYQVVDGRARDEVAEWLIWSKGKRARRIRGGARAAV